jgi:hypothetical protein
VFDGGVPVKPVFRNAGIDYEGTYTPCTFRTSSRPHDAEARRSLTISGQNNPPRSREQGGARYPPPSISRGRPPSIPGTRSPAPRFHLRPDGRRKDDRARNYGRYYDILDLYGIVQKTNGALYAEIDDPRTDVNGDTFVQRNEIDTSVVLYNANVDPSNPGSLESPNQIDPSLSAPVTDEFIVGFEREVKQDFSVGANYIYKRFTNLLWDDWYPDGGVVGIDQPGWA